MGTASVLAVAAVIALAAAGSIAAAADDDTSDDGGGYPIQVTVLPSTPTSTPATPAPSGSPTPRSSPSPSATPSPSSAPSSSAPGGLPEGTILGGAVYVGGLHAGYWPSLDPAAGIVRSEFVLSNVSDQAIDSSATFRLTNFLGQELSSVPPVYIIRLEPGESRVVRVDLERAGQWGFETASFTLSPTSLVDGRRLPDLTRETAVIFLPWLILVIVIAGLAALVIVRIVRAGRPETVEVFG